MKELKCPKCNNVFTVDEADYASIVSQVKNVEFQAEVNNRLEELKKQCTAEFKADSLKAEQGFNEKLSAKEIELGKKEAEIAKLNEAIKSAVQAKELDFKSLLSQKELEIAKLQEQMAGIAQVKEADFNKELGKKEAEIARLNEQIKTEVQAKEITLNTQISQKDMEIIRLQEEINSIAHKKQIDFNRKWH